MLEPRPVKSGAVFETAGVQVRVFDQNHGRIRSLGLRIGAFGYSTDVVAFDDDAWAALQGMDTWVVGCFLRCGTHWTHANLDTVSGWVKQSKPRRTILTHMGTQMDWAWMKANLPPGVEAGYDGMVLEV